MTQYDDQIDRIIEKLSSAREIDKGLKVFGADIHKYAIGPTVSVSDIKKFEKKYSVSLPECYKAFLLKVGNGGLSYADAACGPYYGVYPLGKYVDEILENPEPYLNQPAKIKPIMSDEEWDELVALLESEDDMSDAEFDREMGKVYSGVLPLGSQGCSYLHAIVISGEHAGRVVYLDLERYKPKFCYEHNFLDWYERWLDEIISGILLKDGPTWFGNTMGGGDKHLLKIYENSSEESDKLEALCGIGKLITISNESSDKLLSICHETNPKLRHTAVHSLTQFSYEKAINILNKHIEGDDKDCLIACQSIFWYAKEKSPDWVDKLVNRLPRVANENTFRFICYILEKAKVDYSEHITTFCRHHNEDIRATAYYSLGNIKNKVRFVDLFILGLQDESPNVVHTVLQALSGVKDRRLLDSYAKITHRFKTDEHYILSNLDHNLKELGYGSRKKFIAQYAIYGEESLEPKNVGWLQRLKNIFGG